MAFSQFTFYFLVATLVQLFLLIFMKKEGVGTPYLYLLVVSFAAQNAIYLSATLIPPDSVVILEILIRLFYALSFLSLVSFLSHASEVCGVRRGDFAHQIESGLWMVTLCSAILCVFTDEIITGFRPLSFTITATLGDVFWVRLTHGILAMLTASIILIRELTSLRDDNKKKHCSFLLIAYLSFTVFALVIGLMMQYGEETSFAISFPFITTFSLCLIVYGGFKYGWATAERVSPEHNENSNSNQPNDIFIKYAEGTLSFNEATEKFDLLLLTHAYDKHQGNMMRTAKAIGLGRSTLYKKIQKHKLR